MIKPFAIFTFGLILAPLILLESLTSAASVASAEESIPSELSDISEADPNQLLAELQTLQHQISTRATRLSLQDTVAQGVQNNPNLYEQFSILQQQEWNLIAKKRQWIPSLTISSGTGPLTGYSWSTYVVNNYAKPPLTTKARNALKASNKSIASSQNKTSAQSQQVNFNPTAVIQWNFLDPSRQANINSAQYLLDQQKYLLDQAARNLVSDIEIAYFKVQETKQLIDDFSEIYDINQTQLEILEARQAIGMVNVAEVEQQRSQLFIQLVSLVQYTKSYIAQTASLARLLSLPSDALVIPSENAKPQGIWLKPLDQTIEDALTLREDILALTSQAESQNWAGISQLRSYLPVFSVIASGSLTASNGYPQSFLGQDPGSLYQTSRTWNAAAGIGFNWSFDGGQNAAQAQSNFALSRSILGQKAATEDQAVSQVRSSFGQMMTSKVAIQASRDAYRSAVLAQDAAKARFDVGVGDITSVVQTVSQLSRASTQLATAIFNYNSSISQLYRYSANWPKGAKKQYIQRLDSLRESPKP